MRLRTLGVAAVIALAIGYGHVQPLFGPAPAVIEQVPGRKPLLAGVASWYGEQWRGRLTASGVKFNPNNLTAAHKTLPLNTRVRVTNLENGKSVIVKITDRGPYIGDRVLDLSTAAAKRLGIIKEGLAAVRIVVLG